MYLFYAKNSQGDLIHVEEAFHWKKDGLVCPYCNRPLRIKKSKYTPRHFVHEQNPCHRSLKGLKTYLSKIPQIEFIQSALTKKQSEPLVLLLRNDVETFQYDGYSSFSRRADIIVTQYTSTPYSSATYVHLHRIPCNYDDFNHLKELNYVKIEPYTDWALTTKAKAYGFQLTLKEYLLFSLKEFDSIQEELKFDMQNMEGKYLVNAQTSLTIIENLQQRLNSLFFYFLYIEADDEHLHTMGNTTEPLEEIVKKHQRFFQKHYQKIRVTMLYYCDKLPYILTYFQEKYRSYVFKVGSSNSYYCFFGEVHKIKLEINQVYLLSDVHKQKIQQGIKKRKRVGKRGKESIKSFMKKPLTKEIIESLEMGYSLRETAKYSQCSINTVRKVNNILKKPNMRKYIP